MPVHHGELAVIEPGAPDRASIELESERLDQMQSAAGIGAQTDDVAGIRWNLWLVQDDLKHRAIVMRQRADRG